MFHRLAHSSRLGIFDVTMKEFFSDCLAPFTLGARRKLRRKKADS
jgi:hypothetical protein